MRVQIAVEESEKREFGNRLYIARGRDYSAGKPIPVAHSKRKHLAFGEHFPEALHGEPKMLENANIGVMTIGINNAL